MTARDVGGTTDRNSLRARQANGAAMLVEVDAAAVAVLLLVRLIAEGRAKLMNTELSHELFLGVASPRMRRRPRTIARILLLAAAVALCVSGAQGWRGHAYMHAYAARLPTRPLPSACM